MRNVEFIISDRPRFSHSPVWGHDQGLVEIVAMRLDVAPDAVLAAATVLTNAERQRASRYAFGRDARRFTVARSALRWLLGVRLNVRPETVELVYGEYGKPALSPRHAPTNLQFNVSHTDDVAVFAFASGREVGVDVEAVRELRDADEIAARFFSPAEYASYRALDQRDQALGFMTCWTRKEAFTKARGVGLNFPFSCFDVSLAPGEPSAILRVAGDEDEAERWSVHGFCPEPGHVAAVVAGSHDAQSVVQQSRGHGVRPVRLC